MCESLCCVRGLEEEQQFKMAAARTLLTRVAAQTHQSGVRCFSGSQPHQVTLKDVRIQLKSVTNIQKITATMKMVSAAKYSRAERELKPARIYGAGAQALAEKAQLTAEEDKPNHLLVLISSDRGLCGAIHSSIAKAIRADLSEADSSLNHKLVICGEKVKAILMRTHGEHILQAFNELGRKPPLFEEAAFIAEQIQTSGYEYDVCKIYFNKFKSVISYNLTTQDVFSLETLSSAETMLQYDDVDEDVLRNYQEFAMANLIFMALKESACSEQSARMTAMDNATKNAGDMIQRLQIKYNRTRQAVITTELIEIISGCVALEQAD